MPSGIVIDRAIRQFRDGRFACSLGRERITGLPSLSLVIAVDCIGVVLGPSGIVVFSGIPTGRADDPSLVFAMPEGNAVLVHVHGRKVSVFVFLDYAIMLLPSLCVVIAAVYGELARGVTILHESEDRTGRFVHRDASAHESFSHFDYLAKGFSTVFAPAANHPVPKGQNRSVHANHDVWHPVVFEKLFGFENRLADKGTDLVLTGFGRLAFESQPHEQGKNEASVSFHFHSFFTLYVIEGKKSLPDLQINVFRQRRCIRSCLGEWARVILLKQSSSA